MLRNDHLSFFHEHCFFLQSLTVENKGALSKDYSKDPHHLVCIQGLDLPGKLSTLLPFLGPVFPFKCTCQDLWTTL